MNVCVVLTQYKRNHLEEQLTQIKKQTLQPDYIVVFQNEEHIDISSLKAKFDFIHVKSDFNTKYFGRFSYCFNIPADIFLIFDDDMIPGLRCVESYVNQCVEKNGIIGGNGRYSYGGTLDGVRALRDCGLRNSQQVDFVGHLWCFKKEWLYFMFRDPPFTFDTAEDMHFCYSCKLYGNILSYTAQHKTLEDCSDIKMNRYASDDYSSYKTTPKNLRISVEKYWKEKGINFLI